ncbi:MAG: asparagine--tRNA ligase [Gammaproteobacteria bacterium]|nr:asparagine--tRNA ligase [Gammaproteobacteria bacterium]
MATPATKSTISIGDIFSAAVGVNQHVLIEGWLRSVRLSKGGFAFLSVHDGSCFDAIQVVVDGEIANYDAITKLTTGAAVIVEGALVESQGKGQAVEIQASAVTCVGDVTNPETYPIAKKRHTFEYLRSVAHLRPRTNTFGAVARLRHQVAFAVHEYFSNNGFVWVNTPIITASDCEGAGELFRVSTLDLANLPQNGYQDDFFGTETYLAVSGQLNVEAFCLSMTKAYTFGPTFRAENSNTSRHLAEFWMIEPEIAFADLHGNASLAEDFLKSVFSKVLVACKDDMHFFAERIDPKCIERLEGVIDSKFVRLDYDDAIADLQKTDQVFEFPATWGADLQSEHERFLTEEVYKAPVVVMNYPKAIKPFYMRVNDDDRTVAAMDVLVPGVGEIVGGSQREERLEVLDSRMTKEQQQELWWYRDLRRYGTVPHAGFGAGFERLLMYISGIDNIRDVMPFPRVPNNAAF